MVITVLTSVGTQITDTMKRAENLTTMPLSYPLSQAFPIIGCRILVTNFVTANIRFSCWRLPIHQSSFLGRLWTCGTFNVFIFFRRKTK